MKKILLSMILAALGALIVNAQAPQSIPYQAVARDNSGNVIPNKTISLRFTIHDSISTGTIVYKETQSVTTNALGLFSVNIGQGTVVSGTFAGIKWGTNNKFTQVEMDAAGGTNYVTMGTSQMLSVPYALYAEGSSSLPNGSANGNTLRWNGTAWVIDSTLTNKKSNVGLGITSPDSSALLDVSSTAKGFLMPRMTTAMRNAITSPAVGLQIFNTDDQCVDIYDGAHWMESCGLKVTGTSTSPDYWSSKANFPGTGRVYAAGFSIGAKGYIGTGLYGSTMNDFWEWDQATNIWTQKANFGGTARYGAVGFSIGAKGYIGTGYNFPANFNDFWEWDQATNTWSQKANFGGTARTAAVGFSIGAKGYIGIGYDGSYRNDFWEWDQASNTWTQKANFGGTNLVSAVGFSIGAKGYIGTGQDNSYIYSDFWQWDQASNTWTQKTDFGGTPRVDAVGFSIGGKGYIGTGDDGSGGTNDLWEYDTLSTGWTQKANFGGTARKGAVGFSIGSKGYIGTGLDINNSYRADFFEYDAPIVNAPVYGAPAAYGSAVSVNDGIWTFSANTVYKTNIEGNVGIGTTSPVNKLVVTGALAIGVDYAGTTNYAPVIAPANGAIIEGKVGIGIPNPANQLDVAGGLAVGVDFAGKSATSSGAIIEGNVGIGTSAPTDKLDVFSPGAYYNTEFQDQPLEISSGSSSSDYTLYMGADKANAVSYIQSVHVTCCLANLALNARGGNVGIGMINPGGQFQLSLDQGRKPSTSTWTIASDARLKNMEGAYTKGLKEILQLQPITYHYKNVGEKKFPDEVLKNLNVGFSAQEVQKVFPEAIGTDEDGYLNFNMHAILVAYVNAIKEQQKEIEELKGENNKLKSSLDGVQSKMQSLEAKVDALIAPIIKEKK